MIKWNNWSIFGVLAVVSLILSYISSLVLKLNGVVAHSLAEQLTAEQIEEVLSFQNKWQWVGYALLPLLLLLKISVIALLIDIGCVFYNEKLPYRQLFGMALRSECIFLAVPILKTIWFLFFQPNFTLEDIQYFYPLSALNITGYKGLEPWLIYPLQVLNLFEVVYWFVMGYMLDKAIGRGEKGISIVMSGYGIGLLLWVVSVMFFTLNIS